MKPPTSPSSAASTRLTSSTNCWRWSTAARCPLKRLDQSKPGTQNLARDQWEANGRDRTATSFRRQLERPTMRLNDRVRYAETEPGTHHDGVGRKKWLEE